MIGFLILGFVGEEVVDAVQSFLSSGFILKEINFIFTNYTSAPKKRGCKGN
jgi:hypothetical protein